MMDVSGSSERERGGEGDDDDDDDATSHHHSEFSIDLMSPRKNFSRWFLSNHKHPRGRITSTPQQVRGTARRESTMHRRRDGRFEWCESGPCTRDIQWPFSLFIYPTPFTQLNHENYQDQFVWWF